LIPALDHIAGPAVDAAGRPTLDLPPGSPDWAARALEQRPRESRVDVGGADIEVLTWGGGPAPGVLLVHGHGAHADWWRVIAPQLVKAAGQVVAYSMGGMGGSDWRSHYSFDLFADELCAVAAATGLTGPAQRPWLVAHSFGCLPVLMAAERLGSAIAGIALIDFYLPPPGQPRARPQQRKIRRYDSFEEAIARFRLSPPQDCPTPFLIDLVARRTLRRASDHWTWCTDPAATIPVPHDAFRARLRAIECPLVLMRGERSRLVDDAVTEHVCSLAPRTAHYVEVPDADHHVLLDRPLALVAALRTMLACGGPTGEAG